MTAVTILDWLATTTSRPTRGDEDVRGVPAHVEVPEAAVLRRRRLLAELVRTRLRR